jgi:hypothetical protein
MITTGSQWCWICQSIRRDRSRRRPTRSERGGENAHHPELTMLWTPSGLRSLLRVPCSPRPEPTRAACGLNSVLFDLRRKVELAPAATAVPLEASPRFRGATPGCPCREAGAGRARESCEVRGPGEARNRARWDDSGGRGGKLDRSFQRRPLWFSGIPEARETTQTRNESFHPKRRTRDGARPD